MAKKIKEEGRPPKIPIPPDKYILIDLDGTLIDSNYKITNKKIFYIIKSLKKLNWKIGISSDTPLKSLLKWREELGMNGPLIAERGAVIWISNQDEIEINPESKKYFSFLKKRLINKILEKGYSIFVGDSLSLIKNKTIFKSSLNKNIVLVNGLRKYSIGFWGRSTDKDGNLVINQDIVKDLFNYLKKDLQKSPFKLKIDLNEKYGICIISPTETNKRIATKKLIEILGLSKIGMIGDSEADYIGKDIAIHYTVGNADSKLKKVADYKTNFKFTSGVVELLKKIKEQI